jgi:hypothetical protein
MTDQLIDQDLIAQQMREINKKIEALRNESTELSKKVFHTAVLNFFNRYPEVALITWTQYTPYFNDGDACEFSVHKPNFLSVEDYKTYKAGELEDVYKFNSFQKPSDYVYKSVAEGKYVDYYQKEIDRYNYYVNTFGEDRLNEINNGIKEFLALFNEIEDDVMLSMFEDHVQVFVTKDGIDVEEYSHE